MRQGGSEGNGQHMGGMRWSQTANYGVLPNPRMPHSFLAQVRESTFVPLSAVVVLIRSVSHLLCPLVQVYDLGDPWAAREKGWTGGERSKSLNHLADRILRSQWQDASVNIGVRGR